MTIMRLFFILAIFLAFLISPYKAISDYGITKSENILIDRSIVSVKNTEDKVIQDKISSIEERLAKLERLNNEMRVLENLINNEIFSIKKELAELKFHASIE